jgi:hypothetical protein
VLRLDYIEFDIQCPRCQFLNPAYLRQVITRDVIICRGCKVNINLDDYLNEARRSKRQLEIGFDSLASALSRLGKRI